MNFTRRKVIGAAGAAAVTAALPGRRAFAQSSGPVKIGMSMPQTGSLGAGGQAALVAIRMWVDDVNQKGGLLGRKVEFIVYDDQTSPANTPGIYTKLLDVDKVDLLIAPYGTVPTAPIMPLVRGIRAAKPDIVFVMSYPNDSVAIVRAVNEIGVGSGVKLFGGGMVGLQFTPIMSSLGSALNGITNYNSYVPGMKYPGIEDFLQRYAKRAAEAKVDP